ncbi:NAD-dependent epimerase/dehydratase family protein [Oricola cellulosilytica]|uniref:NAD-dependent epimerase/dehydratase family protein n=1 Tax=Oricola cellulosilytica TaxID=1429082 RepID=A0A4R0PFZ5_9HYPH|nr:NAD-dependent epimerase/dehydratase family protein [Oricola cellulosilytica]TCD15863.1 NAD-dependent epimerase/dehydratase family protein [Oricola cellulosilytica]
MTVPTPDYDTSAPVLVTGATGYVAGWLVKRLLEEGFTVHGAVRDPSATAKVAHLEKMAAENPGTLKLFRADLLEDGSYETAMAGCAVVFHTASPFTLHFTDPQRDLVDPAVKGTRNVLNTANRVESVKRVVVTSSCAAIFGDNADVARAPGGILTEDVWNTSSTLHHQAYSYSKVEAEKAAWDIAKGQDRWKLVTVNPALVIGPGTADTQTSESFSLIRQFGDGTMKAGVPPYEIGMVDVRDVAEAHMRAGFIDSAEGRHIVFAETRSFLDLAGMLREKFGDSWPLPKRTLPKWLVWLVGPLADKSFTRKSIAENMGHAWRADNTKSVRKLGLTYGPVEKAITDMFQQMIDTGTFNKG